jgi:peptidoglycan/LPS O-acetylase OafA/YrhL
MASNWDGNKSESFNGPIWSISVEVLVYIIFFIISRFFKRRIFINIIIIMFCMIMKSIKISSPILNCLTFFYVGGIAALINEKLENKISRKLLILLGTIAIFLEPFMFFINYFSKFEYFNYIFMITYFPITVYIFSQNFDVKPSVHKFIELLGNLTYASYLIHFPIQIIIYLLLSYLKIPIPFYSSIFLIFFLSLTFTISFFIYVYFEMPMQKKIRAGWPMHFIVITQHK